MSQPRVAIYYDVLPTTGFRNEGPPMFANLNLRKLLDPASIVRDSKGHPGGLKDSQIVKHLSPLNPVHQFGTFDLNLLVDYGEDALSISLDWELPHPSAYWVSDTHLGYDYRLKRAKQFDYVFTCQKRAREDFIRDGIPAEKVFWLPHAVDEECYRPEAIVERWDWAFIGYLNCPARVDLLDALLKPFPNAYIGWRMSEFRGFNVLDDACHKLNQARVIPNMTIGDDISMRYFEALASRRCFLTNDIPTAHELFTDRKHLFYFKDIDDAVARMGELLRNDEFRKSVALEGYHEVLAKHTYGHRIGTILKTCLGFDPKIKGELVTC